MEVPNGTGTPKKLVNQGPYEGSANPRKTVLALYRPPKIEGTGNQHFETEDDVKHIRSKDVSQALV
jgi:hypothetical protein